MNEAALLELYRKWNKDAPPEYRGFRCGDCGKLLTRAWHVWALTPSGIRVEVHLCKSCGKKYGITGSEATFRR